MRKILVIADDLSGAAEIAGIGWRFGLPVRVLRRGPTEISRDGLTVLDTDSRSMHPCEAQRVVGDFLGGLHAGQFDLIYKKTDSVLRGNIAAEMSAAMAALGLGGALLVPQNPSRGRTISKGEYRIGQTPLHQTPFADDPDHPARSSRALDLLGDPLARCVEASDEDPLTAGIVMGAASDADEVSRWARRVDSHKVLPGGSGDFFTALLAESGLMSVHNFVKKLLPGRTFLVCGSASASAREFARRAISQEVPVFPMPDNLFAARTSPNAWAADVARALQGSSRAMVMIPQAVDRSASTRLQSALTELTALVLQEISVENLLLEGGATASAVCRRMGWDDFQVRGELAPGVVQLAAAKQNLVIKPGSYPWPESVW